MDLWSSNTVAISLSWKPGSRIASVHSNTHTPSFLTRVTLSWVPQSRPTINLMVKHAVEKKNHYVWFMKLLFPLSHFVSLQMAEEYTSVRLPTFSLDYFKLPPAPNLWRVSSFTFQSSWTDIFALVTLGEDRDFTGWFSKHSLRCWPCYLSPELIEKWAPVFIKCLPQMFDYFALKFN